LFHEEIFMSASAAPATPLFVADDVALDFLNTEYGPPEDRHECLASDQQVLEWLARAGLTAGVDDATGRRGAVLAAALELRATARKLVERRKTGSTGDVSELNRVLALGNVYQELVWKKGQLPKIHQHRREGGLEAVLVPLAEAIARLLAEGDFELVRKCESTDCTLWFYDRTKSHHRRWCSMATCGNRAKVAAFRARQKSE
jgi:predicted RNA-binding Zn ribbon-like protein